MAGYESKNLGKRAGPIFTKEIAEILKKWPKIPTGKAIQAKSGKLPWRSIFHAVGPIYFNGKVNEQKLLKKTVKEVLTKS